MALKYSGIQLEHREIALRDKPKSMLLASPKGTVPVLCVDGQVIDQSLDIMCWALQKSDPDGWKNVDEKLANNWLEKNDGPFKILLDQYKYPNRYPELNPEEIFNTAMELMLQPIETALNNSEFLLGNKLSWVDIAIFPFIRQFASVSPQRFEELPLPKTRKWLTQQIESELFNSIMEKHPTWVD
jgi:glutathione S-transferase